MAKYININGAFFDNSSGSLSAVNDPNILKGLKAGTIASTAQSSLGTSQVSNTVATPTLLPQAAQQQISQGNYNLSPTPTNTTTPGISGGLNTGSTSPTNLVSFKDTLASVMDLAQQKRNTNMEAFMGTPGFKGTLMASDFNTLFSQMNKQGNNYGEMQVEKMFGSGKNQTVTKEDAAGNVTAVTFNPETGAIVSKVDLGPIGTPTGDNLSEGERKTQAKKKINQIINESYIDLDGTPFVVDKFISAVGFQRLLSFAIEQNMTREDFLDLVSSKLSPNGTYGLSGVEKYKYGVR